jgi:hypothetical protein
MLSQEKRAKNRVVDTLGEALRCSVDSSMVYTLSHRGQMAYGMTTQQWRTVSRFFRPRVT